MLKQFAIVVSTLVIIIASISVLVSQSVIGGEPGDMEHPPEILDEPPKDMFPEVEPRDNVEKHYARCLYRDHIDGNLLMLEIKNIASIGQSLPLVNSEGIEKEMNNHVWVRIRGIYVPNKSVNNNRNRPHRTVELEQERFNLYQGQVWRLIESSWALVLSNIEVDSQDGSRYVADVYYQVGGVDRDLAADLIADGYAMDDTYAYDFGRRIP